ncbi:MAG: class I SAM-dependent methyltransferase [Hyphomicrobiaceae bacterium]
MFPAQSGEPRQETARATHFLSRILERILTSSLVEGLEGGLVVVLPNERNIKIGCQSSDLSAPILRLNNYRVISASLRRGSLGFAEAYINRDIECTDLTKIIHFYLRNRTRLHASGGRLFKGRSIDRILHLLRRNSLKGSRRNISEHYDLGNAFYSLWLDRSMTYSSGLYRDGATTLEEAQLAKLDRVRELLAAQNGQSILEIGCGWGNFACRTAQMDGTFVTGLTLSQEQLGHARQSARQLNLDRLCSFRLEDYRKTEGQYDCIVSIEMIEAVGERYWDQYFQTLFHRLKPGGTVVIQAITIAPELFAAYRRRPDFIQRYIFPGGMLPTQVIIEKEASRVGLNLTHTETFGRSYAQTLRAWKGRFESAWPEISKLGFDDRFRRRWEYYLMYCEAGFDDGAIDVGFYKFSKSHQS